MVQEIMPQELAARLQAGEKITLLDVRHEWEHAIAALPESQLIPLPILRQELDQIDPTETHLLVVYCHHGVRSLTGAAIVEMTGRTNVVSLHGGIDAWSQWIDPSIARY
ncbi:rhodanese-like domain-containing protein [Tuwongella immobilis]|uniref:Rhodanese domain-containing protein n=1 Tax=Tuwongella immobilis TaxID=692036 RepID=A0A6C2YUQ9_9BACT|nr:rhodanese-like domain-containing protein [Tuwongella immobilis]VIP04602.1 Sulfurtransferase OS=Sorangium cellulosum So0157-2 GN=SCE1572_26505 PE=4 SV=1: Rhodanese [Tuwongella immobilis]VTS06565.1 Sulfurtransferase OS=Sorangium cellulosum So0157-2 GN=SCE1572_26505 PE=4 SV=1: Rhodanese [Tuwongella immobilis]